MACVATNCFTPTNSVCALCAQRVTCMTHMVHTIAHRAWLYNKTTWKSIFKHSLLSFSSFILLHSHLLRNRNTMASSTSRLMMLFLLVGVGACAVDAIAGDGGRDDATQADTDNYSRVAIPSILKDHASPLDPEAASSYLAKITDGTLNAKDFCAQAKLFCDADAPLVDPTFEISLKNLLEGGNLLERAKAIVDASQALFFDAKELEVGKEMKMPATLREEFPTASFLPEALALKLNPFSGDRMAELLQRLNIPSNSNLAVMMSRTVAQCEEKAKAGKDEAKEGDGKCVASMEGMTKFVADRFPKEARVEAIERSIPAINDASPLKTGTATFKVLDVKEYSHSVVCQKNVFPFAVYECHDMDITKTKNVAQDNMKIYAVAMESREDGHRMKQIASCRATDAVGGETARKVMIPGAAACHWLSDAFVWAAPTDAAGSKN